MSDVEMDTHFSWRVMVEFHVLLDKILHQETNVCWAIALVRQFTALCRKEGLLEDDESLSIQHVINGIERHLIRKDGSIYDLATARSLFVEDGLVLDQLVPLTYKLDEPNRTSEDEVMKFRLEDLIVHKLSDYSSSEQFEKHLHKLLSDSPVAVAVKCYESFQNIVGDEIYSPTPTEFEFASEVDTHHVMVLSGDGVENGVKYFELQESAGEGRGTNGYIRAAAGQGVITHYVEMKLPKISKESFTTRETFIDSNANTFMKVLYKLEAMSIKAKAKQLSISDSDKDGMVAAIDFILRGISANLFPNHEDVHTNIVAALTEMIGESATTQLLIDKEKQVVSDYKLWVQIAIDTIVSKLQNLQTSLVLLAWEYKDLVIPIKDPFQKVKPVLFPEALLVYVEQLERDTRRYGDCRDGLDFSPMRNSIDAISDRDFLLEFLYVNSNTSIHLSQLKQQWIKWSCEEFGSEPPSDSIRIDLLRGDCVQVISGLFTSLTMSDVAVSSCRTLSEYQSMLFSTTRNIMKMVDFSVMFCEKIVFSQDAINAHLSTTQLDDVMEYIKVIESEEMSSGSDLVLCPQLSYWLQKLDLQG